MRILFTHRYYWPDSPPYGHMLRNLAEALVRNGYDVNVYSSIPSYREINRRLPGKEQNAGVSIRRVKVLGKERSGIHVRVVNTIVYCIGLFLEILRVKPDVVTASTFPPVIAAWVASIACKIVGAKFIYHMQDIHPEVSLYSGGVLGRGVQHKFLKWLDNQTLRRSAAVVVLSDDMAATLRERNVQIRNLTIINNPPVGTDTQLKTVPSEYRKKEDQLRVIFAGNLGRFQNLNLLAEGVAKCFEDVPNLELVFLGDGVLKEELIQKYGNHKQVKFFPFLPFDEARGIIEESDIGLVSLEENIYRVSFPSKVSTYLSLGLRLLTLVEHNSCLAQLALDNGLGRVPERMESECIADELKILSAEQGLSPTGVRWYESNWSPEAIFDQWNKLFSSVS